MADGGGNWTWENATSECNMLAINRTWLDEQQYVGHVVDRAVSPVWYLVGVTGTHTWALLLYSSL